MYDEAIRESEMETRQLKLLQNTGQHPVIHSNEEVFISQLHRRAVLLNDDFQDAVYDILQRHQFSMTVHDSNLNDYAAYSNSDAPADLCNGAPLSVGGHGGHLNLTMADIPDSQSTFSDLAFGFTRSRSADTNFSRSDYSKKELVKIPTSIERSQSSQFMSGFYEFTRAKSADQALPPGLVGFSRSRSADIAPCTTMTPRMSGPRNVGSAQACTAEAHLVFATETSTVSFEKTTRELQCLFDEGARKVAIATAPVKTVTRMREKVTKSSIRLNEFT
jgi:hypothetical protein